MGSLVCSDQIMKHSKNFSAASIVMYPGEEGIWLNNHPCHLWLTSFQAHSFCSLSWVLTPGLKSDMTFLDEASEVFLFLLRFPSYPWLSCYEAMLNPVKG